MDLPTPMPSLFPSKTYEVISSNRRPCFFFRKREVMDQTSDAGSQYRCGRVGRGSQPPFLPKALLNPLSNTDTYTKRFQNARFPTC